MAILERMSEVHKVAGVKDGTKLTEEQIDILKKPVFASIATVLPDGSPHVTVGWVDTDGEAVLLNTLKGRVKEKNLRRDPRVAVTVFDPEEPYGRAFHVRGHAELTEDEDAQRHIDRLSKKYTGEDRYAWTQPGDVRVKIRVVPEKIAKAN